MLSSVKRATSWVGMQVRGADDFGYGDTKSRDYAVAGAAAGAVVGATVGTIKGFQSQAGNNIEEVWVDRPIKHPELDGYRHYTRADRSSYCASRNDAGACTRRETETHGWWHSYTPKVSERIVGTYSEPTFQNSSFLEPLSGALIGAVGGGLIGLAAGLGISALQRTLEERRSPAEAPKEPEDKVEEPLHEQALTHRMGAYAVAGTALGAGVGVYLGVKSGGIEAAANEVHSRTWSVPVHNREVIGHIPDGYYDHKGFLQLWPDDGKGRAETQPVVRDVPEYQADGSPKLTSADQTFNTRRYGKVFGGLAGGVLGAGVGLATGVGVGLADKLLTEKE